LRRLIIKPGRKSRGFPVDSGGDDDAAGGNGVRQTFCGAR
jgi:hypothetical protein